MTSGGHCLQIFTTCSTQEYVGQSHDQIQAFSLGQTSPRQNKNSYPCCIQSGNLSIHQKIKNPVRISWQHSSMTTWLLIKIPNKTTSQPFVYRIVCNWCSVERTWQQHKQIVTNGQTDRRIDVALCFAGAINITFRIYIILLLRLYNYNGIFGIPTSRLMIKWLIRISQKELSFSIVSL